MTRLIGIDWGSSNLRAFRFDADGSVVETRTAPRGITAMAGHDFAQVLGETIAGWTDGAPPIVLAGMVGSRNGWHEAPYLPCPADPAQLAAEVLSFDTAVGRCHIVPGLMVRQADRPADVMRGEETQVLGSGLHDGIVVLPGTHSKWAMLADGRVTGFRTAMTGELYAVLLQHSLLGRLTESAEEDAEAFALGARRALGDAALTMLLFSTRAEVLTGGLAPGAVPSYLSGMLLGAEIGAMAQPGTMPVMIGDPKLCDLYARVFALAGLADVARVDGDTATARGLWAIGRKI